MKILEISPEIDKHLGQIVDCALKNGGISVFPSVKIIIDSMVEKQEQES